MHSPFAAGPALSAKNGVQALACVKEWGWGRGMWGEREMGSANGMGGYSADSYDTGAMLTINPVIRGTGAARNSVAMQVCMNAGKGALKMTR